jgi:hypothetical protein
MSDWRRRTDLCYSMYGFWKEGRLRRASWGHPLAPLPTLLYLKGPFLEPGVAPDEELVAGIAKALRDFLSWHDAQRLEIEKGEPAAFGEKLPRALS